MTNRLSELAKRVEELSGPDREVDAEICIAISRYASARAAFLHDGDIPSSAHNSRVVVLRNTIANHFSTITPPPYTASIDAAMTLIPKNLFWSIAYGQMTEAEPLGACVIRTRGTLKVVAEAEAATVEIATVIAALKSRATSQSGE